MSKNTDRFAIAIALGVLGAMFFLGLRLDAAQNKPAPARTAAQAPAKINTAEYRDRAVPPNLVNPSGPVQPIPYSHKVHFALGLQCNACHKNLGNGARMTLPTTPACMSCHKTIDTEKQPIEKLASYAKSGKPIPWVHVYHLLKGVNFSHKTHIDVGVQCATCHGPVPEMTVMREATSVTSMAVCMRCHKMNNAPNSCVTCHDAWGPGMVVVKNQK